MLFATGHARAMRKVPCGLTGDARLEFLRRLKMRERIERAG